MKLIKKTIIILLAAILALGAMACGKTPKNIDIDPNETAQKLINGCKFEETPEIITDSEFAIGTLFGCDLSLAAKDGDKPIGCAAVCSSTPETVLIIKANDAQAAKTLSEGSIADRVQAYIHDYSNYGPEQISKVESCVNKVIGQYVFLIISSDNAAAEKLLDELIK